MIRFVRHLKFALALLLCGMGLSGIELQAANEELAVNIRLVWGSDESKPKDPGVTPADPKLTETLRRMFRWKNYYECNRTNMTVALNQTKKVRVSPKCEVEMTYLGHSRAEIKLIGKGELSNKVTKQISTEPLLLGGPDKNDTAWFVAIVKDKP